MLKEINALHCPQSTYNLRQISVLAGKIHDPLTKRWLADKIVARHTLSDSTPEQTRAVNHALGKLKDGRRVK